MDGMRISKQAFQGILEIKTDIEYRRKITEADAGK
jgi:hypothetical protein